MLRYDPTFARWRWVENAVWNLANSSWISKPLPAVPSAYRGSLFVPYVAQGTILTRDATVLPIASNSAALAAWMAAHINAGSGWGPTSLNTSQYGTRPIPMIVVDSTAPGCDWQYMDTCAAGAGFDQALVTQYCTGRIPLPMWAHPASNGDKSLALYDLGSGIMREWFLVTAVSGKAGHWTATTGGFSVANPGLVDLAYTNPGMQLRTGTSAAVGMHNPLGFIGIAEVIAGVIGHAVAFTCADMSSRGPSWPAISPDGLSADPDAPSEGQWCRLPMSVDPNRDQLTGLPYNPLTQLLIRAFQTYGGFASDKNLFVHAFNCEDGQTWAALYGTDPWAPGGAATNALGGNTSVSDFPWYLTEWAQMDCGRPSPDWRLRRGEVRPWVA